MALALSVESCLFKKSADLSSVARRIPECLQEAFSILILICRVLNTKDHNTAFYFIFLYVGHFFIHAADQKAVE